MILSPIQNTAYLLPKIGEWKQKRPYVTQHFGENPKLYEPFGLKGHNGTDMRASLGTPIYAPMDGKVKVINSKTGYGLHIKIRGKDREVVLGHLSEVFVQSGVKVRMGNKIALSGNTGFSTAPHLHFGYRSLIPGKGDIFNWKVRDYDNGYLGWKNVEKYVITFKGTLLTNNI